MHLVPFPTAMEKWSPIRSLAERLPPRFKICTSEKRKFKSKQRRSAIRTERRGDASKEGQAHRNRGIDEGLPDWIRELEGDAEGHGRRGTSELEGAQEGGAPSAARRRSRDARKHSGEAMKR